MGDARSVNRARWSMRRGAVLGIFVVLFAMNAAGAAMADPGTGRANGEENANGGNRAEHAQNGQQESEELSGRSGASTEPQPLSTADDNGTGANTPGPYDSTRDGSPSENGSGDGAATGKPCAGCVGKADNKNHAGQLPGPQDANNGYECDGNSGIAKTNPAHTGCTAPGSQEPEGESTEPDTVLGNVVFPPVTTQGTAASLPRTGSDLASMVAFATIALITGAMFVAAARRLQRRSA